MEARPRKDSVPFFIRLSGMDKYEHFLVLKGLIVHQHDIFRREVSLQDCHYSFVIVCDHDFPALKS